MLEGCEKPELGLDWLGKQMSRDWAADGKVGILHSISGSCSKPQAYSQVHVSLQGRARVLASNAAGLTELTLMGCCEPEMA